jgi:hypothetical protein
MLRNEPHQGVAKGLAFATHYLLGLLLIRAIRAASTTASRAPRAASELAEAI